MKKISIIIPVYFNEPSLLPLFEELKKVETQLHKRHVTMQLIFVDDGSHDNSWDRLLDIKQQRPETSLIKLTRNFGALAATKAGLQLATGDCFSILAADLQDPPSLILEMVDFFLQGHKFIIAIRKTRQDPFLKKFFAACYYKVLRLLVAPNYPKKGFDLFLLDKAYIHYLQKSSASTNTQLLTFWLGIKPIEIFYERQKRVHGKSRWTFAKNITFLLDSILGFSILPIRMISYIGLTVSLGSFFYGLWIFLRGVLGTFPVQGYASIIVLITFLLGLIILMLGIIGEYILRIFYESNIHIQYVVDETL